MKRSVIFLCAAALLFCSSCATIFSGSKKSIRFESNPPGATVQINGIDVGHTPCQVMVKRKLSEQQVMMVMKGYNTRTFILEKSMNKMMWWDVVWIAAFGGGLIFIAVDLATGAAADYDQNIYTIDLEKKE